MSQSKVAMKKDSMRKNKKLVINIALDKEVLASRLEADHDLGSLRDEKESFKSSERRRDVVCSKGEDIVDKAIDDHSSVRGDGIMPEVDVGTGLSGALNRLREQGTFKGESKIVGVKDNHEDDRFKDRFKDIEIQRVDKWGRILTEKEAYRSLCHRFHGKGPGKKKQEKQRKKHEDKSKHMESSERAVERIREVHAISKSPYIVL